MIATPCPQFRNQMPRIVQQFEKQEDAGDLPAGGRAEFAAGLEPLVDRLLQVALQDRLQANLQQVGCGLRNRFGGLRTG